MSGDLISLRMLVISAFRPAREIWRQGAALASVPVECLEAEPAGAMALLSKGGFDIVVLDAALAEPDRDKAIKNARALKPLPLIVMAGGNATSLDGVDAMLDKPDGVEETRALVERCVRVKLPIRMLVVDDSGTMRSIVRKILSACRYTLEVSEAEEGIAALNLLSAGKADFVMLDYNMPGFNGFETLSEIKRVAPRVAVVMMTSTIDEEVAKRALAAGAIAFLKKPFYPTDIDAVLDRHFGLK